MECEEMAESLYLIIFISMLAITVLLTANWARTGRK